MEGVSSLGGRILASLLTWTAMFAAHSGFGRNYGRSLVISQQGIVASSQALFQERFTHRAY